MSKQIFRKAALERLASPEQFDELTQMATPRGWLAFLALVALLAAVIAWGFLGRIPIQIAGPTILLKTGGVKNIVSLYPGQVSQLLVQAGDIVHKDQVVAYLVAPGESERQELVSPYDGRILELRTSEGSLVDIGASLMSLELVGEKVQLQALMYVPAADGKKIEPGMTVQVAPATVRREEFGFLLGKVGAVGDFPATYQGMYRTLGSDELIRALGAGETPVEVLIELVPDPNTPSGYLWSSSQGPADSLQSGTLGSATVIIGEQRPVDLVLP
ncbi:MAG: NHLP bacteriocin system secretion protein [Ardenticatenales bacterium]|nr:NHLP bacteriocin system secretion protein [Ardenticatenales bacterium]